MPLSLACVVHRHVGWMLFGATGLNGKPPNASLLVRFAVTFLKRVPVLARTLSRSRFLSVLIAHRSRGTISPFDAVPALVERPRRCWPSCGRRKAPDSERNDAAESLKSLAR